MADKIPYMIWAPNYWNLSGGIIVLHRLCHLLNESGYTAFITGAPHPEWNEIFCPTIPANCDQRIIAVYPEIVDGNPFGFKHRVRWVMYFPGVIGGPEKYEPEELVFSYSKYFMPVPQNRLLTVHTIDYELFNIKDVANRDIDCYWDGKGSRRAAKKLPLTDGMIEITREWPATSRELAALLKRTSIFYSYDHYTTVSYEAFLCGCRVILLPEMKELTVDYFTDYLDVDKKFRNFVEVTQAWARW
jgi:hypothetical protein